MFCQVLHNLGLPAINNNFRAGLQLTTSEIFHAQHMKRTWVSPEYLMQAVHRSAVHILCTKRLGYLHLYLDMRGLWTSVNGMLAEEHVDLSLELQTLGSPELTGM